MTREPEKDVIPVCEELGIGFVPYSPLSLSGHDVTLIQVAEGHLSHVTPWNFARAIPHQGNKFFFGRKDTVEINHSIC